MHAQAWRGIASLVVALHAATTAHAVNNQPGTPLSKAVIEAAKISTAPAAPAPPRKVPSIIGMGCADARNLLAESGIRLLSCELGSSGNQAVGFINRQDPQEDQPLTGVKGVKAWTEPPPADRTLPNLAGMSCAEAQPLLKQQKVRLGSCLEGRPGNQAPGRINQQSPEAGTSLKGVTTVRVWTEPPPAPIPDLTGKTCGSAAAEVQALAQSFPGLTLKCEPPSRFKGTGEPGRIYGQDPAANSAPLREGLLLRAWVVPEASPTPPQPSPPPTPPVPKPAPLTPGPEEVAASAASQPASPPEREASAGGQGLPASATAASENKGEASRPAAASAAGGSSESSTNGIKTDTDIEFDWAQVWPWILIAGGVACAGVTWRLLQRTPFQQDAVDPPDTLRVIDPVISLRAKADSCPLVSLRWATAPSGDSTPAALQLALRARSSTGSSSELHWLADPDDPKGGPDGRHGS